MHKKVLIYEEGIPVIPFEDTLLLRKENEVYRTNSYEEMMNILKEKRIDLLILDDKVTGISVEDLVKSVREEPSLKDLSILLLSSSKPPSLFKGVNIALSKPIVSLEFNESCKKLLNVEARRELRLLVYVQVQGFVRSNMFLCNSRNISASGILIMTTKTLKMGESVQLLITLPREKEKVKALAKVVREAREVSTQLNAYGLHFTEISEKDRERIRKFILEQEGHGERL